MATSTARKKAKSSPKGRLRNDAPRNFWHGKKATLQLGLEEFRVTVLRPRLPALHLDDLTETITWTEPADSGITTGTIQYREPANETHAINIVPGDRVRLDYSPWGQGRWKELWTMRVDEPSATLFDGSRSLVLANDLLTLSRSTDDFNYGKSKTRSRGWLVYEAIHDVCRRFGVKVGTLAKMTHRVKKKVWLTTSPLRVINDLMLMQRNYSGRRYVLRFSKGRLNIVPLRRSEDLLLLGPSLIDASLQQSFRDDFATALTVRSTVEVKAGTSGSGSHHKKVTSRKISVKVSSRAAVKRYGYIHRIVYAPGAESTAEARTLGLRHLAKIARPNRAMTLNHVGIPTLHKGDAIRLSLPEIGVKQIVYVSEVTHTVSAGNYTMDVTVIFDDPYVNKKADRVTENKDSVALLRKRKRTTKKKKKSPAQNHKKADIPKPPKETKGDKLKRQGQR